MKNLGESYYIYIIKPTLMITTFYINYQYLEKSEFPNRFYHAIYFLAFLMKPLFFLALYVGLILNLKLKNFMGYLMSFIIILSIYFGFPIKEYSDYFDSSHLKSFFEGKEYNLSEYVLTHFIVNLLTENVPIIIFVFINNNMLENWKDFIIDPIIVNSFNIFFTIVIFYLLFGRRSVFTK